MSPEQLPCPLEGESKVDLFRKKEIRKVHHKGEWWFVANDVITALTESTDPNSYIKKMRQRDESSKEAWGQIVTPLPFQTTKGVQDHNCLNIEGVFRLMQSIPSPKAEPFKKWLAKVGFERLQEIQDPGLAVKRAQRKASIAPANAVGSKRNGLLDALTLNSFPLPMWNARI